MRRSKNSFGTRINVLTYYKVVRPHGSKRKIIILVIYLLAYIWSIFHKAKPLYRSVLYQYLFGRVNGRKCVCVCACIY